MVKVVCFDIGGVLAHVCRTWSQALENAGCAVTPQSRIGLEEWPNLRNFQRGVLSQREYLQEVSSYFGIPSESALAVHDGILLGPTAGTFEIVQSLNEAGITTACFSNTNQPHWLVLTDPNQYPNIAGLKVQLASHLIHAEKPALEAYQAVEKILSHSAHEIVFFEDSIKNYEGALNVGWDAHLIDHSGDQANQIREYLNSKGIQV